MMNVMKLQSALKDQSDDWLTQQMQQPTGEYPQYLVLSEINRRQRLRNQPAPDEQVGEPSLAEEKTKALQNGIRSTPTVEQSMPTQGYASGGIVKLAGGGSTNYSIAQYRSDKAAAARGDAAAQERVNQYEGGFGVTMPSVTPTVGIAGAIARQRASDAWDAGVDQRNPDYPVLDAEDYSVTAAISRDPVDPTGASNVDRENFLRGVMSAQSEQGLSPGQPGLPAPITYSPVGIPQVPTAQAMGPAPSFDSIRSQFKSPDPYKDFDARLTQMQADSEKNRNSDRWMAAAQMGLGMMTAKGPNFLNAVGEGAQKGMPMLMQAEKDYREGQFKRMGVGIDLAKARAAANQADNQLAASHYANVLADMRGREANSIARTNAQINAANAQNDAAYKQAHLAASQQQHAEQMRLERAKLDKPPAQIQMLQALEQNPELLPLAQTLYGKSQRDAKVEAATKIIDAISKNPMAANDPQMRQLQADAMGVLRGAFASAPPSQTRFKK